MVCIDNFENPSKFVKPPEFFAAKKEEEINNILVEN